MSRGPVVWTPPAAAATDSGLARYMRWLADDAGGDFASYAELWAWSAADLEGFWDSVWRYFDIRATPYDAVLPQRAMPGARWFEGARLNYAEHALRAGEADGDGVAVVELDEAGTRRELRWDELRLAVGGVAGALRERGIGPGDVVAGYLPNCTEAVVAYLACASVGAIWSSCAPDLAPASVLDRFAQLRPAALIACDGYRYGGRAHDRRAAVEEIAGALATLRIGVVMVDRLGEGGGPSGAEAWEALAAAPAQPMFEALPFDHPLYVLFSSGTTGPPKGIVHGHGGQLLDHVRHHALHFDLAPADRFFFYTTTNWMIWNWLVAGLLVGSTIVLYDGSPRHPELDAQFAIAAQTAVTLHGTSAGYLTACAKAGLSPGTRHDLAALRAIASTGSPLPPETFHWIHEAVGERVWPISTSGGTDVCSAFVSGNPLMPVRAGEIQCRCLGAAIDGLPELADSLVIGVEEPDGSYWMPLFVALESATELDEELRTRILDAIRAAASARHVPDEVVQVPAIPRTHTGKKLEVPIKRIFMGADPATTLNRGLVADPAALDAFVALAGERASRRAVSGPG